MNIPKLYILLLFSILLTGSRSALSQVNLNINNGMPSNHVYQMVRDKFGYLWMATTNGVVRYNGYDLKTYTIADGLPSNDVWSIHLDKKERLWLLCFGNAPGYIYKNKYHETYVKNDSATISADRLSEHKNGITFIGKYREPLGYSWFWEKNDTITNLKNSDNNVWYFNLKNNSTIIQDHYPFNDSIYTYAFDGKKVNLKHSAPFNIPFQNRRNSHYLRLIFYDKEVLYGPGQNSIYCLDLNTLKLDSILFTAPVDKIIHTNDLLYVVTGNYIHKIDSTFSKIYSAPIADVTSGAVASSTDIIYLLNDPLWGKTIATQNNGIYIVPVRQSPFKKLMPFDAPGYKYIGRLSDSSGYWWNASLGRMATIDHAGQIRYRTYHVRDRIRKILPYNKEHSLIFFYLTVRLMSNTTAELKELTIYRTNIKHKGFGTSANDALVNKDTMLSISSAGLIKAHIAHDTFFSQPVYFDRCTGIAYDSLRNLVLVHNTGKILFFTQHGKALPRLTNALKRYGINQVEQVIPDNQYGNIFVKSGDKFLCINPERFTIRQLFTNDNLSNARIFKRGNMLVAAGTFGVSFCRIIGPNNISKAFTHYNEKFAFYRFVNDVHISQNTLILDTDNGLYSLDIPGENLTNSGGTRPFKLIVGYSGNLKKANNNDTFRISQENTRVTFDVINPSGSGSLQYQYKIDGIDTSWRGLNSNELDLSNLTSGKYYTLLLKIRDDAWIGNPIRLRFYSIPLWWQTNPGRTILWVLGVTLFSGLILATVLITRRIIVQNNIKRNKLLELEIKSIHSQINPHFIFNTLNTTLHYIVKRKLDEAYDHVTSFSSLLRAYLKSSRNRYITLGEEINNLKNYIHLQQTRFENTFTYKIVTDLPDDKTIYVPSLLLQPIVENAINHGLLPKNAPGNLIISFKADAAGDVLTCAIDDNGIGRKKALSDKPKELNQRESYGNHLIKELVDILNRYENAGIELTYIDKELPETGTTVIITIKIALKDG